MLFKLKLPHNEGLVDCHSITATKPISRCRNPTSQPFIKVCSYEIIFIHLELNYFSALHIQDWNWWGKPQNGASESIPRTHVSVVLSKVLKELNHPPRIPQKRTKKYLFKLRRRFIFASELLGFILCLHCRCIKICSWLQETGFNLG